MNYEINLLHYVGLVAKKVCAAAAETAAHEGDDNTPSGPMGRVVKTQLGRCPFFRHLKLKIVSAIPASNDEKYCRTIQYQKG